VTVVAAAVIASVVSLLLAEGLAWFPWLAERLIRHATGALPAGERERWRTEWLAELEAIPGLGISKLVWAINVTAGVPSLRRTLQSRPATASKQSDALLLGFLLIMLFVAWQSIQHERARSGVDHPVATSERGLLLGPRASTESLVDFATILVDVDITPRHR
jgi:hypothetical protein